MNLICHAVAFSLPFNDPEETEKQISYSGQQVCQRQIVSNVWKVDFAHFVEAVEKIGQFQKALQMKHKEWARKLHATLFFYHRPLNVKWHNLLHQTADL